VEFTEGEPETYVLPLALAPAHTDESERIARDLPQALVARVALADDPSQPHWLLYDSLYEPAVARSLLDAIGGRRRANGRAGQVTATPTAAFRRLTRVGEPAALEPRASRSEQSNTSITFGDRLILKLFRRLEPGINPDLEIGQALTADGFEHVPQVAGWMAYRPPRGEPSALAILQQFVPNLGDAWEYTLDQVSAFYERAVTMEDPPDGTATDVPSILAAAATEPPEQARELVGSYLDAARLLGERTGQLHRALAGHAGDSAFTPEPFTALYQRSLYQTMRSQASETFSLLNRRQAELPAGAVAAAREAVELAAQVHGRLRAILDRRISCQRIRCHGDFHLGQVLWTGRDFVTIDFEGEPGRPLAERRHKRSALTDVAGMLRSFHYAALGTLLSERIGGTVRPEDVGQLQPWAAYWYQWVSASYLAGYREATSGARFLADDQAEIALLLELSMLQKVLYELNYELNNRPDWVSIPLRGLVDLLGRPGGGAGGPAGSGGGPGGSDPAGQSGEATIRA